MVRLKDRKRPSVVVVMEISIPVWCDWRFSPYGGLFGCINFNSSMVRLKVARSGVISLIDLFQFQYGAIEGQRSWPVRAVSGRISIPVWCDWRNTKENFSLKNLRISIPVWCDWRSLLLIVIANTSCISIPVWCDWRYYRIFINGVQKDFNSSMVRLKGCWRPIQRTYDIIFQFQYGAIEGS